jgi:hypothetical protein
MDRRLTNRPGASPGVLFQVGPPDRPEQPPGPANGVNQNSKGHLMATVLVEDFLPCLHPLAAGGPGVRLHLQRRCRVCNCTYSDPCPEGCEWVEDDLCSACLPENESEPPRS